MRLPSSEALSVIFDSVSAAQKYLREENRQVKIIEEFKARKTIKRLFFRISKCTSRAPVAIRGRLAARVYPIIKESVIDLEATETIFDAIRSTFEEFPDLEASRVALESIDDICRADFSLLGITFQKDLEEAIKEIVNTEATNQITATVKFLNILGTSLDDAKRSRPRAQSHGLITKYVAEVAQIWRHAELKPARARSSEDGEYTSKFHRFVEYILAGLADPQENHSKLPLKGSRNNSEIDRMHYDWHVSDDHVRAALNCDSNFRLKNSIRQRRIFLILSRGASGAGFGS
jgi:hypothetical protein